MPTKRAWLLNTLKSLWLTCRKLTTARPAEYAVVLNIIPVLGAVLGSKRICAACAHERRANRQMTNPLTPLHDEIQQAQQAVEVARQHYNDAVGPFIDVAHAKLAAAEIWLNVLYQEAQQCSTWVGVNNLRVMRSTFPRERVTM